jgi:hypothetical protein
MEHLPKTIAYRLEYLERSNRRMKFAASALFFVLLAGLLMGETPASHKTTVVEAKKFILRAPNGRISAELSQESDEGPEFDFFDQAGKRRIGMGLWLDDTSFVTLYDQYGKRRIDLHVLDDGEPGFEFYADRNLESHRSITLQVSAKGTLELVARDSAGKGRAALGIDTDGTAAFDLYDSSNGKTRIALAVLKDGHAGLALVGENGQPVWHEP